MAFLSTSIVKKDTNDISIDKKNQFIRNKINKIKKYIPNIMRLNVPENKN